tara:strand:+ start:13706 stop:14758 length:1053 start_codon:yes stop_codon:yes gene_type:complete
MNKISFIILFGFLLVFKTGFAQYEFSGKVDSEFLEGTIYLSVVEDYRKISGVYPEQILNKTFPDSTGAFTFTGNNLPADNKIYRIHVDTCSEEDQNTTHFTGHCPNSEEIVFIANNRDTLSLPFSFDNEMFCQIVSKNDKAQTLLKIDSLKNDMRFAFGTYRSEANRKINSEKWFKTIQEFSEDLNEPLAELYSYAFLSDRTNDLHAFYLEDLKTNNYYNDLLNRLTTTYPNSSYSEQYSAELSSDKYILTSSKNLPWWVYLGSFIALASVIGNFYFFGKLKRVNKQFAPTEASLSNQEKKVLALILEEKSNKEIASEMFVSVSTVKTHINNLYKKLNVSSRDEVKKLYS